MCNYKYFTPFPQGFDPNSAFFTKVVNKKKKPPTSGDTSGRRDRRHESGEETEELDPVVLRSRQLASKILPLTHRTAL